MEQICAKNNRLYFLLSEYFFQTARSLGSHINRTFVYLQTVFDRVKWSRVKKKPLTKIKKNQPGTTQEICPILTSAVKDAKRSTSCQLLGYFWLQVKQQFLIKHWHTISANKRSVFPYPCYSMESLDLIHIKKGGISFYSVFYKQKFEKLIKFSYIINTLQSKLGNAYHSGFNIFVSFSAS